MQDLELQRCEVYTPTIEEHLSPVDVQQVVIGEADLVRCQPRQPSVDR